MRGSYFVKYHDKEVEGIPYEIGFEVTTLKVAKLDILLAQTV